MDPRSGASQRGAFIFIGMISTAGALSSCAPPAARQPTRPTSALQGFAVPSPPIAGAEASPITFERIARWPEPGWQVPRSITYSPDGKWVTFLASEKQNDETALFAFDMGSKETRVLLRADDLAKTEGPLTRVEELRRERQRGRSKGITGYRRAKRTQLIVVPLAGDVFARRADGGITRLTQTPEPEIDPQPCDTGERVAFVRQGELFVVDVATRKETALTSGAPAGVTRGVSDFNGQEEFDEHSGYFWSPNCDRIAYLEVDERGVDEVPILGYRDGRSDLMVQRYPVTGGKNPVVRLGVVELATRKTTFVRLPFEGAQDRYLGRFAWTSDGRALFLQVLSRDQKTLKLVRVDAPSLATKVIASETASTWIEFSEVTLLERSPKLLWTTERSGFRHIEMIDASTGAGSVQLTGGKWDVDSIKAVDEQTGRVFFMATKDSPLERHLYTTSLSGQDEPARITQEPGFHEVTVADDAKSWVDVHSAVDRTPRAVLHQTDGVTLGDLPCPLDADFTSLAIRPPELIALRGPSGDTLYGSLLPPRNVVPGRRYPAIVMVYGGPGHQSVQNKWSARLLWEHLADRGVAVFQLDNRGTPARGRAFKSATYKRLGELELQDQIAGVDYLASLPYVDASRIGIYGHSYGGFMTTLAMVRAPTRFRVGVAGSPLVDMRLYDSGYTERYMGTPAENPSGYAAADVTLLAPNLRGKLFVLHALMDENVHFLNTARLIGALSSAAKRFDLLVFPGERHGYQSPEARRYAMERVVDYFARNL